MANRILVPLFGAAAFMAGGLAYAADRPLRSERPLVLQGPGAVHEKRYDEFRAPPRPYGRPVNGGPGYVGSDYGLGKPAFTGLGSRPDWGHSD